MSQILRLTPTTLELLVYVDGSLTDLAADPTLTVTDANGSTVTAGAVTKPSDTTGTYQATLAGQTDLNRLTAVWVGKLGADDVTFTQSYEIVGNFLFAENAVRVATMSGNQTPLSDESLYPDVVIGRMRDLITDQFEQRTGRSWTRRYCRIEMPGTGTSKIDLWDGHPRDSDGNETGGPGRYTDIRKIIKATVGGTAQTLADLVIDGSRILHKNGTFTTGSASDPHNVVVEYEYGPDPVPHEANEHGIVMAIANLVASDVSAYASSFAGQDGTVSFSAFGLAWPSKTFEWLKWHKPVLVR